MATFKQKLAAQKMVDNGGNVGKAMIAAGYSPSTAKTPQKLTKSKGWYELMDEYLPDDLIAKQLRKLLDKKVFRVVGKGKNRYILPTKEIDANAVAKGLELALKIKGKFTPEKTKNKINTIYVNQWSYLPKNKDLPSCSS